VFDDDRYWVVEVIHAKGDPSDLLMQISVTNAGPDEATLHVLPHLWFRNTWAWVEGGARPALRATGPDRVRVEHPRFGDLVWHVDAGSDGGAPELLFCENETNLKRLYGSDTSLAFPKDGINDHVVGGAPTVNPEQSGDEVRGVVPADGGAR
jgi:hypothetical protein